MTPNLHSCSPTLLSCSPILLFHSPTLLSSTPKVFSYSPTLLSCSPILLFCNPDLHSCSPTLLSCSLLINYATRETILTNNNYRNNNKQLYTTNGLAANTRLWDIGWLTCISQSLLPHFLLSLCDRKYARRPPMPIASVVSSKPKKKKKTEQRWNSFAAKRQKRKTEKNYNTHSHLTIPKAYTTTSHTKKPSFPDTKCNC